MFLRANWRYVAAMGALGYTAFNALFYLAAHRTSALNMSILQGAIPALVLLGARAFLGVPPSLGCRRSAPRRHDARRRRHRRSGRSGQAGGARLQRRRRHDAGRTPSSMPAIPSACANDRGCPASLCSTAWPPPPFLTSLPLMLWEIASSRIRPADRRRPGDARLCGARPGVPRRNCSTCGRLN